MGLGSSLQLWPVGCAGYTVFGCFWQTSLCWNFGQQFFSGPRYIVNPQLPAVGRTSKKHTVWQSLFYLSISVGRIKSLLMLFKMCFAAHLVVNFTNILQAVFAPIFF